MTNIEKRLEAQSAVLALISRYLCQNDPAFQQALEAVIGARLSDDEEVDEIIKSELRNLMDFKFN